ncbi:hypothetical protein C8F01DRAFT_1332159 [Mycena amicta]|nr:hypothetical protein C8F01DRAFT_1332159 [Mycena amicta]
MGTHALLTGNNRLLTQTQGDAPSNPRVFAAPAIPRILNTKNGVVSTVLGMRYTAAPLGGFPVPHICESVWRNMTQGHRTACAGEAMPKCWLVPYRGSATDDLQTTSTRLSNAVRILTGCKALTVIAPIAHGTLDESRPPPYSYLLVDGDTESVTHLTNQVVWSTPDITFFAIPYQVPRSSFLMSLEGFTCEDTPENRKILAEGIVGIIRSHQPVMAFLAQNASFPEGSTPANEADIIVNSIAVLPLRMARNKTTFFTVWNVYLSITPDMPFDLWLAWVGLLRGLAFSIHRSGRGECRTGDKQFKCSGCKSCDHPAGMCPYPNIEGWLGPSAATVAADDKTLANFDLAPTAVAAGTSSSGRGRGMGPTRGGSRGGYRGGRRHSSSPYHRF